jgi:hypothetical protein
MKQSILLAILLTGSWCPLTYEGKPSRVFAYMGKPSSDKRSVTATLPDTCKTCYVNLKTRQGHVRSSFLVELDCSRFRVAFFATRLSNTI